MNRTELKIVALGFGWRILLIAGVLWAAGCTEPEPSFTPSVERCTGEVAGTAFGAPVSGVLVVRNDPSGYVFEDLELVLDPPPPEWRELSIRLGVQWSRASGCASFILDGWRLDEWDPLMTVSHSTLNYNASGDIDTGLAFAVYGELFQPARLGEASPKFDLIVEECAP